MAGSNDGIGLGLWCIDGLWIDNANLTFLFNSYYVSIFHRFKILGPYRLFILADSIDLISLACFLGFLRFGSG